MKLLFIFLLIAVTETFGVVIEGTMSENVTTTEEPPIKKMSCKKPDHDACVKTSGYLLPHPDPEKYYQCKRGIFWYHVYEKKCDSGNRFNYKQQTCDKSPWRDYCQRDNYV